MVELWNSLSYENKVILITFALAILLLLIDSLFIARWFYLLVQQVRRQPTKEGKLEPYQVAEIMVDKLVRDPDPLSELVRYSYLAERGIVSPIKGPEVARILIEELASRWRLYEIGPFDSVTRYDPREHRSNVPIAPGESVRVIKPGWRLGEKVIKYAIVIREGDRYQ